MKILNVPEAKANFYKLIEVTSVSQEPVFAAGKLGNAVLLAEDDWNMISETLQLLLVSGIGEPILEGKQKKIDDCAAQFDCEYGYFNKPSKSKRMLGI